MNTIKTKRFAPHFQRYLLTGILTVIPIWISWLVFDFVFKQLSDIGMPLVQMLSRLLEQIVPTSALLTAAIWFQPALAAALTLVAFYLLGGIATMVIGKRLLNLVDWVMNKIPLIDTIYNGVKKLLSVLQQKPESVQRVVMIPFPSPEMRAVGFVTQVFKDHHTGQELAAVFMPTTPNPTTGFLEIVPLDKIVSTDWTMDEAMSFIISGGTMAPKKMHYSRV
jgi:uncharacterized membrane protein